jgi:hypothetical protein
MRGLALAIALSGCGYRLVHPDAPVPALDTITDTSTEGQLGLRATARLRRHFAGHPPGSTRISGRVEVGPDLPTAYADEGRSAAYRAVVTLVLEESTDGPPTWRSHTTAAATWVRGPDPLATTTARQLALADATEAAVDAAWHRYLAKAP